MPPIVYPTAVIFCTVATLYPTAVIFCTVATLYPTAVIFCTVATLCAVAALTIAAVQSIIADDPGARPRTPGDWFTLLGAILFLVVCPAACAVMLLLATFG